MITRGYWWLMMVNGWYMGPMGHSPFNHPFNNAFNNPFNNPPIDMVNNDTYTQLCHHIIQMSQWLNIYYQHMCRCLCLNIDSSYMVAVYSGDTETIMYRIKPSCTESVVQAILPGAHRELMFRTIPTTGRCCIWVTLQQPHLSLLGRTSKWRAMAQGMEID